MGNSTSSAGRHQEDTVDYGYLTPQGVCTGPMDWNNQIVTQFICERKLAPFYRPLEDYDPSWDDEQILGARKEFPDSDNAHHESVNRSDGAIVNGSKPTHNKRMSTVKEPTRHPEALIYKGAVECPICFLYYPPNINHCRCCDQAICTECFVQIKRHEPTTTHLVSEPVACPYCVQENFGIVYTPPPWRSGIGSGSGGMLNPSLSDIKGLQSSESSSNAVHKRRQKSYGHDSPEVVTADHIRPDWEAKLAAVRAAVTRRANRRIIMRQVGDRLIPVGISSGRVHPVTEDGQTESADSGTSLSRRSRRRQQAAQNQDLNQLLGSMGLGGQDLEELMIMEAMRLSLLDHEEQQRREAQNRQREGNGAQPEESTSNVESSALQVPPTATTSTSASSSPSTYSSVPMSLPTPTFSVLSRESRSLELAHAIPTSARNRTPSPSPATIQSVTTSSRVGRTSTPPPFSTLGAALSAAATTAAALASAGHATTDTHVADPHAMTTSSASSADNPAGSNTNAPTPQTIIIPAVVAVESTSSLVSEQTDTESQEAYGVLPSSANSSNARLTAGMPTREGDPDREAEGIGLAQ